MAAGHRPSSAPVTGHGTIDVLDQVRQTAGAQVRDTSCSLLVSCNSSACLLDTLKRVQFSSGLPDQGRQTASAAGWWTAPASDSLLFDSLVCSLTSAFQHERGTWSRASDSECAGSVDTTSVECPAAANLTASDAAELVLPTPPCAKHEHWGTSSQLRWSLQGQGVGKPFFRQRSLREVCPG